MRSRFLRRKSVLFSERIRFNVSARRNKRSQELLSGLYCGRIRNVMRVLSRKRNRSNKSVLSVLSIRHLQSVQLTRKIPV